MTETHWTGDSIEDFVHRLSFDFITQLGKQLENGPFTRAELARKLKVSKGRVSQILNNPSNLTLKKAVSYARALGMKVSIVAYNDHDPDNHNGPISSEIFNLCWEREGRPSTFHAVSNITASAGTDHFVVVPLPRKGFYVAGPKVARTQSGRESIPTFVLPHNDDETARTEIGRLAVGG